MLLKKLEMFGFKSFADKTEFDFQSGVTAFVGPNGCGKSNVVDAVRWILGEQSAKAVRGAQMQDVIFNGTSTRRSLGYAEASLTFLNDRGVLPTEYSEVCVTRRLYRSGESEYFLNKQPCRLRDIRQLFMDTGVGMDTYSIIEQGKVSRFIESNSKERRAIFEEAAGISRYKTQRREAQSRLERTKLNVQKVDIKLEEQRKQLRSVKYQAAKAKRYREYTARLREIVISLSMKNYADWENRRKELEQQIHGLERRHADVTMELQNTEADVHSIEAAVNILEQRHMQKRDESHRVESRIEAAETAISHNEQRIREYQDETERSTRAIWGLNEKLRQTKEEMEGAARDLESIREAIQRQAAAIAAETEKNDAAGKECDRLGASIEEWKNRTVQIIERMTTLRNELTHMDQSRRQQLARRSRLLGTQAEKTGEIGRIDAEVERLTGQRDEISGRLADRSALLHERETQLTQLTDEAQTVESRLREMHQREAQLLSRREILQDIELRAEDVESGVKRLLRGDEPEEAGLNVRGMVADLVRADLCYAPAVESALGDAAQYVVVTAEQDAGTAAALLRTDRAGRAGLIPLLRVRGPEADGLYLTAEAGVIGRASDLVRYDIELEPVVRHLLGDTWVVEDLRTALRLSATGHALRFVTLDGERVEPGGAIIGGEPLPRIGIVSRKSELESIERELIDLAEKIAGSETDRGRVAEHIETIRSEAVTLRKEIEKGNLEKLSNENEILNLRRRQKGLSEESIVIAHEIAEIEATVHGYDEREKAIGQELNAAIGQRDQLQAEMDAARRHLADQQAVVERLRADLTRLKVELADKEARRGGLEHTVSAARNAAADLENQITAARQRMDDLRAKQTEAEQEIVRARAELEELGRQQEQIAAAITSIQQEQAQAQARRAEHAERMKVLRAENESVQKQLHQIRLEEQELRVRIEGLAERVFNEHGVRLSEMAEQKAAEARQQAEALAQGQAQPPQELAADGGAQPAAEAAPAPDAPPAEAPVEPPAPVVPPAPVDWTAIQQEIEELREKIRRMGGVNEESIDEEAGLEIGIVETERQRDDLMKAIEDLQEVIRKLNRISREKFMKTFEEVRVNFQDTFRRLFGGGRCDLALQHDEGETDVLEAGIEVLACPPGKELKSITLMSGGEKTMTTIALLFAIFRAKPSPFCILDEVDAALDESNIDRFTTMLQEYITNSQFIIITHSKRTVGIAGVLYGITMQEKGVSRKVSVRVEDAIHLNNN